MCAAQLSKIICYNPELPYLVLIPTVLLSAGMLMFFTLGSSMVGDICDEDELNTGTRSEGSYYSVYWWFIKMGTAFASVVTGWLLVFTSFDEKQNVTTSDLVGNISIIKSEAEEWIYAERIDNIVELLGKTITSIESDIEDLGIDGATKNDFVDSLRKRLTAMKIETEQQRVERVDTEKRLAMFDEHFTSALTSAEELSSHFAIRLQEHPDVVEHTQQLVYQLDSLRASTEALQNRSADLVNSPSELLSETKRLLEQSTLLKRQAPKDAVPPATCRNRFAVGVERCFDIADASLPTHGRALL